MEGANASENNANPINLAKVLPSAATMNSIQISPKSPDEELLHFAQIQALRDGELNRARHQLQEVGKFLSKSYQDVSKTPFTNLLACSST